MKVMDLLNMEMNPHDSSIKYLTHKDLKVLNDRGYLQKLDEFQGKQIEVIDPEFNLDDVDLQIDGSLRINLNKNGNLIDTICDPQTDLNESIKIFGITLFRDNQIVYRMTKDSLKNK